MEIKNVNKCPYTDHNCGEHAQCSKCSIYRPSKCDTCRNQSGCFKGQHWGKEKCWLYWQAFEGDPQDQRLCIDKSVNL